MPLLKDSLNKQKTQQMLLSGKSYGQLHFDERTWQEENKPPIDLTMFWQTCASLVAMKAKIPYVP